MAIGPTHLMGAVATVALISAPPAYAVPANLTNPSKSEAILGGQSRLASILAEQGAPTRSVPVRYSGSRLDPPPLGSDLRPVRTTPSALSGKPDIFGSVALKVGRTPLDRKWRRVALSKLSGPAAAFARSLRSGNEQKRIDAINRYVNGRIHYVDDVRQHDRADVWSTANETLDSGRGDCEDYAIVKLRMLRVAGFSDRDLYLVILKDLVRRSDHAVAVVRSGDRMFVLDNGTDRILESEAVIDYRPILTFSSAGSWTHGYKIRSVPVQVAKAVQAAIPSPAAD